MIIRKWVKRFARYWHVIADASNGRESIEHVESLRPDVVTMDVEAPELDGVEATRHIAQAFPQSTVLILSQDPGCMEQSVDAGARACLPKSDATCIVEMVASLTRVSRKGSTSGRAVRNPRTGAAALRGAGEDHAPLKSSPRTRS
ncbi:MAG TPA: response regulator transcription factor [Terriglobales bacterium]